MFWCKTASAFLQTVKFVHIALVNVLTGVHWSYIKCMSLLQANIIKQNFQLSVHQAANDMPNMQAQYQNKKTKVMDDDIIDLEDFQILMSEEDANTSDRAQNNLDGARASPGNDLAEGDADDLFGGVVPQGLYSDRPDHGVRASKHDGANKLDTRNQDMGKRSWNSVCGAKENLANQTLIGWPDLYKNAAKWASFMIPIESPSLFLLQNLALSSKWCLEQPPFHRSLHQLDLGIWDTYVVSSNLVS